MSSAEIDPVVTSTPQRPNGEFDPDATRASMALIRATLGRYFRPEVHGAQHLEAGRCMVVGCHSGVIPYDAACTLAAIEHETGRVAHAVGDRFFGRLKFVEGYLRRHGAIVGEPEESAALLRAGNILLVFPGGARDMTRPIWQNPYRVLAYKGFAKGAGGYIKIALSTGTPIVPLAVVGAEEAHMLLYNSRRMARLLRVPFFPIVAFPFPIPVKLYIRFGRAIRFREGPEAANDQATVDRLNARVRRRVQALIDDTRERRDGIIWSSYRKKLPASHGRVA
jgi:1-acyl-sn-glycerol-3-phosphate acyltransferase